MKNLILIVLIVVVAGCRNATIENLTTVKVKEVEQVGNYTYLLVKGKGPEYWVAVPSMDAKPGETYSYQGGLKMKDFYSKELDKTFKEVLFLEGFYSENMDQGQPSGTQAAGPMSGGYENKVVVEKANVNVEPGEGTIAIAEIYEKAGSFEGKTIRVRGQVTKYNAAIMDRNWVHIQDGSEHEGKFDLAATSGASFSVGDVVTLEGVLALNRDFGYGYSYDLLLENATVVAE